MNIPYRLAVVLSVLVITAKTLPASASTTGPFTVSFDNLVTGANTLSFSLPRFDQSLGSLQSIDIAYAFSGIVNGSSVGVNQFDSMTSTVSHAVNFFFTDISDGVFIAAQSLALTASIPAGAQNTTIWFGPEFQSTTASFSVGKGSPRFDAWNNGPGNFSGTLAVACNNTTMGVSGIHFFGGQDTGLYNGSLSITYNYVAVPEPSGLALCAMGLLLFVPVASRKACCSSGRAV